MQDIYAIFPSKIMARIQGVSVTAVLLSSFMVLSHIVWVATYIIYHEDHEGKY